MSFSTKLPSWATVSGLLPPPSLSMEQCSSEVAAAYKASLVADKLADAMCRGTFVDLTGGYGVDFSALAPWFQRAVYVESQPVLCEIARHNFPLLGLSRAEIHNADGQTILEGMAEVDLCYVDPARRDGQGRKVMLVEDCVPNVARMLPAMLGHARHVLVKLSPMLDIGQALLSLHARHHQSLAVVSRDACRSACGGGGGRVQGTPPVV